MNEQEKVERLEELVNADYDGKIYSLIPKGILRLDDQQIATVSFVFWVCHLAEVNMHTLIKHAWDVVEKAFSKEDSDAAQKLLDERIKDKFSKKGRKIDVKNLKYFGDKVKVINTLSGNTDYTNLLWILKDLRDNISHTRINDLQYKNRDLNDLKVQKTLLIDYVRAMENHKSQSEQSGV